MLLHLLQLGVGDSFYLHRTDLNEYLFEWKIRQPPQPPTDTASGQSTTLGAPAGAAAADAGREVASRPAHSRGTTQDAAAAAAAAAALLDPGAAAAAAAAAKVGVLQPQCWQRFTIWKLRWALVI